MLDDALAQRLLAHANRQRPGHYVPPPPGAAYEDPQAVLAAEVKARREQVH